MSIQTEASGRQAHKHDVTIKMIKNDLEHERPWEWNAHSLFNGRLWFNFKSHMKKAQHNNLSQARIISTLPLPTSHCLSFLIIVISSLIWICCSVDFDNNCGMSDERMQYENLCYMMHKSRDSLHCWASLTTRETVQEFHSSKCYL